MQKPYPYASTVNFTFVQQAQFWLGWRTWLTYVGALLEAEDYNMSHLRPRSRGQRGQHQLLSVWRRSPLWETVGRRGPYRAPRGKQTLVIMNAE